MTTSELEKWIIEFMNREDFDENYGDDSLAELVERGFLHAIEVIRIEREKYDKYPYQPCTFGDLIARLKEYAGVE